jgi:predicted Zn finger-like uncharacterized protein
MIVFCEKCNSKFQVDDAKIPDTGIKARCSVCSHAFVLKKETQPVPAPAAEPVKAQAKPAGSTEFDTSIFNEATGKSPPMGSGGPFFSRNTVESSAKPVPVYGDVVVEVSKSGGFEEVEEIVEAGAPEGERLADIFDDEPPPANKPGGGYDAFAAFVDRHKTVSTKATAAAAPMNSATTPKAGRDEAAKTAEPTAFATPQVPEVMPSVNGQLPANQFTGRERGIITKLDDVGMNDEYVVQMVQEICHAVKYVEGVEKPDWPTRMMGLDMLCKIRGLYAGEKKDDPTNRQLQIVAGINM